MQQWISVVHIREFSESLCISQQLWIVKTSTYMSTKAMQRSCSNSSTCGEWENWGHFVHFSNGWWQVWIRSQEEKNLSKDQLQKASGNLKSTVNTKVLAVGCRHSNQNLIVSFISTSFVLLSWSFQKSTGIKK